MVVLVVAHRSQGFVRGSDRCGGLSSHAPCNACPCRQDPLRIVPGIAGATNLMPLYNNITKAIRAVDQQHMVFYEVRQRCHAV